MQLFNLAALAILIPAALAFHEVGATEKGIAGAPCSCNYNSVYFLFSTLNICDTPDSYLASTGKQATLTGFVSPDGYCGDNGAKCSSSTSCYSESKIYQGLLGGFADDATRRRLLGRWHLRGKPSGMLHAGAIHPQPGPARL